MKNYRLLKNEDILKEGDETVCLSALKTCQDAWHRVTVGIGKSIGEITGPDFMDMDTNDRIFRRKIVKPFYESVIELLENDIESETAAVFAMLALEQIIIIDDKNRMLSFTGKITQDEWENRHKKTCELLQSLYNIVIKAGDSFTNCRKSLKSILTSDSEYFTNLKALGVDKAIQDHRNGLTEPFEKY